MNSEGIPREGGRDYTEKRKTEIVPYYLETNPFSVLISTGKTKVVCAATTGNWMPPHVRNLNKGWVGATYSMLPSSCPERIRRERKGAKGRTKEIERMIARSLRSVCELDFIPNESIIVDCDVIQADGGTRTASVTGAFTALYMLMKDLQLNNKATKFPITDFLAGISAGLVHGKIALDLDSSEDKIAQVDMNMVMTGSGRISEIQATGEEATFRKEQFHDMVNLAEKGIMELIEEQKKILSVK